MPIKMVSGQPVEMTANDIILAQIAALEVSVPAISDRTVRELVAATPAHGLNAKAVALETQIIALRAQLTKE